MTHMFYIITIIFVHRSTCLMVGICSNLRALCLEACALFLALKPLSFSWNTVDTQDMFDGMAVANTFEKFL